MFHYRDEKNNESVKGLYDLYQSYNAHSDQRIAELIKNEIRALFPQSVEEPVMMDLIACYFDHHASQSLEFFSESFSKLERLIVRKNDFEKIFLLSKRMQKNHWFNEQHAISLLCEDISSQQLTELLPFLDKILDILAFSDRESESTKEKFQSMKMTSILNFFGKIKQYLMTISRFISYEELDEFEYSEFKMAIAETFRFVLKKNNQFFFNVMFNKIDFMQKFDAYFIFFKTFFYAIRNDDYESFSFYMNAYDKTVLLDKFNELDSITIVDKSLYLYLCMRYLSEDDGTRKFFLINALDFVKWTISTDKNKTYSDFVTIVFFHEIEHDVLTFMNKHYHVFESHLYGDFFIEMLLYIDDKQRLKSFVKKLTDMSATYLENVFIFIRQINDLKKINTSCLMKYLIDSPNFSGFNSELHVVKRKELTKAILILKYLSEELNGVIDSHANLHIMNEFNEVNVYPKLFHPLLSSEDFDRLVRLIIDKLFKYNPGQTNHVYIKEASLKKLNSFFNKIFIEEPDNALPTFELISQQRIDAFVDWLCLSSCEFKILDTKTEDVMKKTWLSTTRFKSPLVIFITRDFQSIGFFDRRYEVIKLMEVSNLIDQLAEIILPDNPIDKVLMQERFYRLIDYKDIDGSLPLSKAIAIRIIETLICTREEYQETEDYFISILEPHPPYLLCEPRAHVIERKPKLQERPLALRSLQSEPVFFKPSKFSRFVQPTTVEPLLEKAIVPKAVIKFNQRIQAREDFRAMKDLCKDPSFEEESSVSAAPEI
jgi:hypothetical protein